MFPLARFLVADESMRPNLNPGDYVFVNRWAYLVREPKEGDVVVLHSPEATGLILIKRIGRVVDRERLFVFGDNPGHSRDSRHFGLIHRRALLGKVWMTAKP